jgi:hypothetical protein
MKPRISCRIVVFTVLATALGTLTVVAQDSANAASGQKPWVEAIGTTDPGPLPPGGPTPRMSDGKPDLSGIWFSGVIGRPSAWSRTRPERVVEDPVPFRPDVDAKIKSMTRAQLEALDPTVNCLPRGVPGMFTMNPHPSELVTKPGTFIQLVEAGNQWRKIHTDKRPHPEYPDPLFNGNSSAWWEGDTLIIDSIAFDERTWITGNGWYHSDQLRVIERIRRPSMNFLEYQFTIEDPKVLTRPWTSGWRKFSLAQDDDHLLENYCTNEQNSDHLRKLVDQEANRPNQPPLR